MSDYNNIRKTCESETLSEVQKNYDDYDINYINNNFVLACKHGHLEIAQQLYSQNEKIYINKENAFIWSCMYGYLDIVQWLCSLNIDIHYKNEAAFNLACENMHIDIVKWLYQFNIDLIYLEMIPSDEILINIFQLNEREMDLFKIIMNDHKESEKVISMLQESNTNYEMLDHFIFRKCCYNNDVNLVKILANQNKKYHYEIDEHNEIINYGIRNE